MLKMNPPGGKVLKMWKTMACIRYINSLSTIWKWLYHRISDDCKQFSTQVENWQCWECKTMWIMYIYPVSDVNFTGIRGLWCIFPPSVLLQRTLFRWKTILSACFFTMVEKCRIQKEKAAIRLPTGCYCNPLHSWLEMTFHSYFAVSSFYHRDMNNRYCR